MIIRHNYQVMEGFPGSHEVHEYLDVGKVEDVDVGCWRDVVDGRRLEVLFDDLFQLGPEQPLDLVPGKMRAARVGNEL